MRYLLDTDTVSELVRPAPNRTFLRRLSVIAPDDQGTSSITVGELVYGAYRRGGDVQALLERIDDLAIRHLQVMPFDGMAARIYGEIRVTLELSGSVIGDADTRIAAIALANDLIVVTGNTRHFERIPGLDVENWLV